MVPNQIQFDVGFGKTTAWLAVLGDLVSAVVFRICTPASDFLLEQICYAVKYTLYSQNGETVAIVIYFMHGPLLLASL